MNPLYLRDIGSAIYAERQKQGIIQKDLAIKCKLSEGAIMRIENGRPVSTRTMEKVCRQLGLKIKIERA